MLGSVGTYLQIGDHEPGGAAKLQLWRERLPTAPMQ